MKKLLFIALLTLGIAGFVYFHYSTPQVLNRRLDSLLDSLSFGTISLQENTKAGDRFAEHFLEEVTFTGNGNDIIAGTPTRDELRELYLEQLRSFARNCQASHSGDTNITLKSADNAQMETTISLQGTFHGNQSFQRDIPVRFTWQKKKGSWHISAVQLLEPTGLHF